MLTATGSAITPQPHQAVARIANIDAVRGLAVLGIFFLNIFSMGISSYEYVPTVTATVGDSFGQALYYLLLRDRFITLFSILFGAGLYIQWQNFSAQGLDARAKVKSRLYWLMLFGLLHGLLLWPGDILLSYGLCGLLLWRYRQLPVAELLRKAQLFIAIGLLVMLLMALIPIEVSPMVRGSPEYMAEYRLWTGDYGVQLQQQLHTVVISLLVFPMTYLWILSGLMLLGIYLLRQGWFNGPVSRVGYLFWGSLLLSLLAYSCSYGHSQLLQNLALVIVVIAAIPMALWFLQLIVRYCGNQPQRLKSLQAVGRVALTLYILQSVVGVSLFRHIAPELLLTMDFMDYLLLAVIWSAIQLALARCYLHFLSKAR
ncbi:DUF418 domain-containing protein [Shewanella dokdonensis]|uniref:DUF418 domain-containing protein n=1 Tax=Shewanella dokdonensis TaxID=712036 RepID=UPI001FD52672|nr:DUF418 domain-containing protein [Shewanella dokdonensis]